MAARLKYTSDGFWRAVSRLVNAALKQGGPSGRICQQMQGDRGGLRWLRPRHNRPDTGRHTGGGLGVIRCAALCAGGMTGLVMLAVCRHCLHASRHCRMRNAAKQCDGHHQHYGNKLSLHRTCSQQRRAILRSDGWFHKSRSCFGHCGNPCGQGKNGKAITRQAEPVRRIPRKHLLRSKVLPRFYGPPKPAVWWLKSAKLPKSQRP